MTKLPYRFPFAPQCLIVVIACWVLATSATALADNASGDEKPAFQRALPDRFFQCLSNSQCVVVQGWCATFAINKTELKAYEKIPADPAGKGARGCPPGWLPPGPKAVCEAKRCKVISH